MNEKCTVARFCPEGFVELFYSEYIDFENQSKVLNQGLKIAGEKNLLDGIDILVDASKTKSFDRPAGILTKHASESVKINHIAIFGSKEAQNIIIKICKDFNLNINNCIKYFDTRDEAVDWLKSIRKISNL